MVEDFLNSTVTTLECEGCPTVDCSDPLVALSDPRCPPPKVILLTIQPAVGEVDVGQDFQFRSYAEFEDGRRREVTAESVWGGASNGVAESQGGGIYSGLEQGSTTVSAAWQGLDASGILNVLAACRDLPLDVVLVMETGPNYGQDLWGSAINLAYSLRLNGLPGGDPVSALDRIAIVHFGEFAQTVQGWTDTVPTVGFTPDGTDLTPKVAVGRGLRAAQELLQSARSNTRRVVVLFSTGLESVCDPSGRDVAANMKADGTIIAVIGGKLQDRVVLDWAGNTVVVQEGEALDCEAGGLVTLSILDFLGAMASDGLVYYPQSVGEVSSVFARIASETCVEGGGNINPLPLYGEIPDQPTPCGSDLVFSSQYGFPLLVDQNPNTVLDQESLARAQCIFAVEYAIYVAAQAELGIEVLGSHVYWVWFPAGVYYDMNRKGTCDPEDGIDDHQVSMAGGYFLSARACLNFPPEP